MVVQEIETFVRDTLFYMNIVGMNPENQNTFAKARTAFTMTLGTFITFLILLEVIINWKGIESLQNGADVSVALVGLLIKMVLMVVHNSRIKNLLGSIRKCEPLANTGEETKQEIESIYTFMKKFRRGMKMLYITTNIIFYIKPLILKSKTFPNPVYQPFNLLISPRYEIAYFLEYLKGILILTSMLSFDLLFMLFVTYALCELKMVKYAFANININPNMPGDQRKSLKEIREVVQHHAFVLRFIKEVNNIFSHFMLTEFVACTLCICFVFFSLIGEGFLSSPTTAVKSVFFIFTYTAELYVFCYGGNIMSEESTSVADAVYESDWWIKSQTQLRRAMLLAMLRAQKAEKITAGRMFDMDLKCFTIVVQTSYSFFTLIQAIHGKEQL